MANTQPGWKAELNRDDLDESSAPDEPFTLFRNWFEEACNAGLKEPTAMTLATADADGRPSARMVLLKQYDETGFVFYTNTASRKGRELTQNPCAALSFWWDILERQIRIEGMVERVDDVLAEEYFHKRPRGSQLGAAASNQSQVVSGREALESRLEALKSQYADAEIPRPNDWGGYRLIPEQIEFWQGRDNRLHDRIRYRRSADFAWLKERLAP